MTSLEFTLRGPQSNLTSGCQFLRVDYFSSKFLACRLLHTSAHHGKGTPWEKEKRRTAWCHTCSVLNSTDAMHTMAVIYVSHRGRAMTNAGRRSTQFYYYCTKSCAVSMTVRYMQPHTDNISSPKTWDVTNTNELYCRLKQKAGLCSIYPTSD